MKQEKVRALLQELGLNEKQTVDITLYLGMEDTDTHPNEEFSYSETISSFKEDQASLAIAARKDAIEKKFYEENKGKWYTDTIRPLKNRVKRWGNYTQEEVDKMDVKELMEDYNKKMQSAVSTASEATNEQYIAQIRELQETIQSKDEKYQEEHNAWKGKIDQVQKEAEIFVQNFKVNDYLNRYIRSTEVEFDIPSKVNFYAATYIPKVMDMYKIDPETGAVTAKDGQKAIAPNKSGFIDHVGQAIKQLALLDGNWKQSNDKDDATKVGFGQQKIITSQTVTGKPTQKREIDNSSVNALAAMLGAK